MLPLRSISLAWPKALVSKTRIVGSNPTWITKLFRYIIMGFIQRIIQKIKKNAVLEENYTVDVVRYWEKLSADNKTNLLKEHNCWEGMNTYLWSYLPGYVKTYVEEEYQKSRR
jgi:hypothetical protein